MLYICFLSFMFYLISLMSAACESPRRASLRNRGFTGSSCGSGHKSAPRVAGPAGQAGPAGSAGLTGLAGLSVLIGLAILAILAILASLTSLANLTSLVSLVG